MSTVLAFDFGLRRIGVATGNTITNSASALTVVNSLGPAINWSALEALVAEWRPAKIIVGLPLLLDGTRQRFTDKTEAFADQLAERSGLPVIMVDERLSSRAAEAELKSERQRGRKSKIRKAEIDATAARIILETWFSEQP